MNTYSRGAALLIFMLFVGCAQATGTPMGGDFDSGQPATDQPDAPPAPPGTPDAGVVIVPDAAPGTPDAATPPPTPDAAPPPGMCNLVTGQGCAAPTPACDLGANNTHVCRQVLTPGMVTSTCNDATSCAAGYSCVGASATASSCLRYCASDGDCGAGASTGALCAVTLVDGSNNPIPNVSLCTQACGPIDASGCPSGWGCRLGREPAGQMRALTTCAPAGAGGRNAPCTSNSDCQAGFQCFCTDAGCTPSLQKCKKLCNATDNTGCPTGSSCSGLSPSVVIGGKAWGACP